MGRRRACRAVGRGRRKIPAGSAAARADAAAEPVHRTEPVRIIRTIGNPRCHLAVIFSGERNTASHAQLIAHQQPQGSETTMHSLKFAAAAALIATTMAGPAMARDYCATHRCYHRGPVGAAADTAGAAIGAGAAVAGAAIG